MPYHTSFATGREYIWIVSARLHRGTAWADAGYEIAFEQFVVRKRVFSPPVVPGAAPAVSDRNGHITITGHDFTVMFDRQNGRISKYAFQGTDLLKTGPRLTAFRASIDNSRRLLHQLGKLRDSEDTLLRLTVKVAGNTAVVQARKALVFTGKAPAPKGKQGKQRHKASTGPVVTPGLRWTETYTVYPSGLIKLAADVQPVGKLPDLPRLGYELHTRPGFDDFSWYGRGPQETYSDRKTGAKFGVYSGTVDQQFVNYPMPQENGNKTDVRWALLQRAGGVGIKVRKRGPTWRGWTAM